MKRRPGPRDMAGKKDDDAEQFARAMAGVRRVAPDPRGRVRVAPSVSTRRVPQAPPLTSTPAVPRLRSGQVGHDDDDDDDDDDDSTSGFVAPGVDRRELRKLKRGAHTPRARLDLHGMTAAEAIASVMRFIEKSRPFHRCVCIVHGRGLHSHGNVAILRTRVRGCLRQSRGVLAYADAPRNDGGDGAVYVLLRR